jgi:hypothetical protein
MLEDLDLKNIPNEVYSFASKNYEITYIHNYIVHVLNYFNYLFKSFKNIAKRFEVAYRMGVKFYSFGFTVLKSGTVYYSERRGYVCFLNNIWYFTKYLHLFSNHDAELFITLIEFHMDYWVHCLKAKQFRIFLDVQFQNFYVSKFINYYKAYKLLDKKYSFELFLKLKWLISLGNPRPSFIFLKRKKPQPKLSTVAFQN